MHSYALRTKLQLYRAERHTRRVATLELGNRQTRKRNVGGRSESMNTTKSKSTRRRGRELYDDDQTPPAAAARSKPTGR